MGVINLTPDSFFEPSRVDASDTASILERIRTMIDAGASYIDLGAVSTRPGADPVPLEEEWARLEPVLLMLAGSSVLKGGRSGISVSIDTTSAEIVRRAYDTIGPFIVNDISAGEDDPLMLSAVGSLGLTYIAMHKRGTPQTMDARTDYPGGVLRELTEYFRVFARTAESFGIRDWILDPGLGFAKSVFQNWDILQRLDRLSVFGRPILIGAADKRFTQTIPSHVKRWFMSPKAADARKMCRVELEGDVSGTDIAHALAVSNGASILRVHNIPNL